MRPLRALTRNHATTRPDSDDPRLRTRVYAVPFAGVWEAVMETAEGTRGWSIREADPNAGEIRAEAATRLWKFVDDVDIRVSLDEEGQTRVDLTSRSRVGSADLGTNARRIARFLHALERRIFASGTVTR